MTSEVLAKKVNAARVAEFGDDSSQTQWPSAYFRYDIYTIAPNGAQTPRAPKYCATEDGGGEICDVITGELKPCKITKAPAMGLGAGWQDSDTVPWCEFEKSPKVSVNAGLLLDYYNHGYPPNRARNSCEL